MVTDRNLWNWNTLTGDFGCDFGAKLKAFTFKTKAAEEVGLEKFVASRFVGQVKSVEQVGG